MQEICERIRANPNYQKFVRTRRVYSWTMALLGAAVYYGFILLVAFKKEWLATPMGEGMTTSIGVPIGVGVIVFTIILTWVYVRRANSEFDETSAAIVQEAQK